jgi:glutamyl-tRNA reductase
VQAEGLLKGFVLLCTCNRREVYLELAPGISSLPFSLVAFFSPVPGQHLQGTQAARHLFRVTSSIESMVVGENQISGQVRCAVQQARDNHSLSPLLEEVFQAALRTAKEIRRKTGLGTQAVSVASVGVAATRNILSKQGVQRPHIAIVGAGIMAKKAADAFSRGGPCKLFFVNRTSSKAKELASSHGGTTISLAQVLKGGHRFDAILTAVTINEPIIDLACAKILSKDNPIVLTDLGSPPNITKQCSHLEEVTLLDMDQLREISDAKLEERQALAEKALPILERGITRFMNRQKAKTFGLDQIRKEHLRLAKDELERLSQFGEINELYKTHLEEAFLRMAKAHAHLHLKDLKTRLMPANA